MIFFRHLAVQTLSQRSHKRILPSYYKGGPSGFPRVRITSDFFKAPSAEEKTGRATSIAPDQASSRGRSLSVDDYAQARAAIKEFDSKNGENAFPTLPDGLNEDDEGYIENLQGFLGWLTEQVREDDPNEDPSTRRLSICGYRIPGTGCLRRFYTRCRGIKGLPIIPVGTVCAIILDQVKSLSGTPKLILQVLGSAGAAFNGATGTIKALVLGMEGKCLRATVNTMIAGVEFFQAFAVGLAPKLIPVSLYFESAMSFFDWLLGVATKWTKHQKMGRALKETLDKFLVTAGITLASTSSTPVAIIISLSSIALAMLLSVGKKASCSCGKCATPVSTPSDETDAENPLESATDTDPVSGETELSSSIAGPVTFSTLRTSEGKYAA